MLNIVSFSCILLISNGVHKDEIKDMWGYSKWLITSAFLSFSSTNIFYFVGGALLGSVSLGAVRATQTLMGVFNVLLQFLDNYLPIKLINIFVLLVEVPDLDTTM